MSDKEIISLKEYIDLHIKNLEKQFVTKADSTEKATELAHREMERRLESMNEVREQLRTQVPKGEYLIQVDKFNQDIRVLRDDGNIAKGKASLASVVSIVAVIVSIIGIVLQFIK